MTTPTPPPGYKLVKGIDIKDRVPEGALFYCWEFGWYKSNYQKLSLPPMNHSAFYAIPSSLER